MKLRPDTRIFERSAGSLTNLTWPEAAQHWPEMVKGRQSRDVDKFGVQKQAKVAMIEIDRQKVQFKAYALARAAVFGQERRQKFQTLWYNKN